MYLAAEKRDHITFVSAEDKAQVRSKTINMCYNLCGCSSSIQQNKPDGFLFFKSVLRTTRGISILD